MSAVLLHGFISLAQCSALMSPAGTR